MNLSSFAERLEVTTTLLMQVRNLNQYGLGLVVCSEGQSILNQVHQRLGVIIAGLTTLTDDIRRHKPEARPVSDLIQPGRITYPCEQGQADYTAIRGFLSPVELADLGQLEHSYQELSIARDLVDKFRRRIISIGEQRRAGNDRRADL